MAKEEKKTKLELALENLDKSYGIGTILSLDSKIRGDYDVISSGSLAFDWRVLGVGGFVKGRMYELMGWEGVGKSTLCGHAIAECQKKGGTALCIDAENAIDKEYFAALGVDTSKLLLSQPYNGEEGFDIAMETIKTGEIDLLIIDSDSSMLPKAVVDGDVGDSAIGKKAKLNSNAYPKLKTALVNNKTCVLVVSQYREKIGLMFGNPTTTQGGHALKFYSDCRIEITRPAFAKEKEEVYGSITKVKTIKNKTFSPFKSCTFEIIYGKGIDKFGEIIELGIEMGIIAKNGSWYSYQDTKLGQGTSSVRDILMDNPELYEEIKEKVIANIVKS